MKHNAQVASGMLAGLVAAKEWIEPLTLCAEQLDAPAMEQRELLGKQIVIKRSHLRGKSSLRHGIRGALGFNAPRLAEFQNLNWLRKRLFLAPEPVFAGVVSRGGLPRFQFLATELLPECRNLREFLEQVADHRAALASLAREVARMHALGFVHRDLYPRNLLVHGTDIAFVDAWRGGPGLGWRGPDYDLACLMLYGSEWLTRAEQERFFADYLRERTTQDRAVKEPGRFAAAVEANRARLRSRLEKRPHERRGLELPVADWRVPLPR